MATRTIHAEVIVRNTFVPFIVSIDTNATYAEVANLLEIAGNNAVYDAIPQLATEVRITLEVGE